MDRRDFLNITAAAALSASWARTTTAATLEAPPIGSPWRTFEVVTDVEVWPQDLPAKVWLPLAIYGDTDWQKSLGVRWSGNPSSTGIYRDPRYGAPAFYAQWDDRAVVPKLQVVNRITTRNRSVELQPAAIPPSLSREKSISTCSRRRTFPPTASCVPPRAESFPCRARAR